MCSCQSTMLKCKGTEAAKRRWKKELVRTKETSKVMEWYKSMVKAIETAKSGKMGVNRALKDRLSGRVQHGRKSGPKPYLSPDKERELVTFFDRCVYRWDKEKRRERFWILLKVSSDKEKEGAEQCVFNGEGWWVGFKQRHPNLTLGTSDAFSQSNQESISCYWKIFGR